MTSIDHVNIVVADIERSVRFYSSFLGLKRGFEATLVGEWIERVTGVAGAHARCVFMEPEGGGVRLELLQYLNPAGTYREVNSLPHTLGIRHVAFVVDDIEALVNQLRNANVPLISDPVEVPFAVGAMGRKRLCYFHDPDGTLLEVASYG